MSPDQVIEADGSLTVTGKLIRPILVYPPPLDTDAIGEKLLELARPSPWRSLPTMAFDWAVAIAAMWAALRLGHPLAWVAAAFVIGARQHGLLVLMHDASHYRLHPNRRWNERLGNWFAAYPILISTDAYRKDHLQHHYHVNTMDDPNWVTKIGDHDWEFPKTARGVAWVFLKELFGVGLFRILTFLLRYARNSKALAARKQGGGAAALADRLVYYAIVFSAVTYFGAWKPVLLLWYLPGFTILPALLRLRVIAEHFGLEWEDDLSHSRNYRPALLERALIAPHNIGFHLVHHLFPSIPWYNLPKAQALLEQVPEYKARAHESGAILGLASKGTVLHEILTSGRGPVAPRTTAA